MFAPKGAASSLPWPMRVPLRLQARAITGVGDVAGAILANAKLEGWLAITPKLVRGQDLQLTSAKLNGKLSLLIDLVNGRFEVLLSGGMTRYLIPGLGIVDVLTDLRVVPDPSGRGSRVIGTGKAWVRRLDNGFFRDLTGGLPRIETNLERGPDGVLRFTNLQLYSPKLRLAGSGQRLRDGSFHIVAAGRQATYGPLRMVLDGDIARPRVDLLLDRPNDALGITGMHLLLAPTATGFDYRASGGSKLGPFTSNGRIVLAGGTMISIAALDAGGAHASGDLISYPGWVQRPSDARRRNTRRHPRLRAGSRSAAHRRAPHSEQRELPRSLRSAHRPDRWQHHPRRRADHPRRSRRRARRRRRRHDPGAAHRQRQAGQRLRPGPRRLHRPRRRRLCVLDASPTSRPTSFA